MYYAQIREIIEIGVAKFHWDAISSGLPKILRCLDKKMDFSKKLISWKLLNFKILKKWI
jgi:hypothetical protein